MQENTFETKAPKMLTRFFTSLRFEALVFAIVVRRDLTASIVPAILFSTAAFFSMENRVAADIPYFVFFSGLYFSHYIYCFCLANQITGLEEDRINKPDRAIPSGLISKKGAWTRWIFAMTSYPITAIAIGGFDLLRWAILWQFIIVIYNFGRLDSHWFGKNVVFITSGTIALLGAAWEIVQPMSVLSWNWAIFVAVAFGLTLNIQDLRDQNGDAVMERKTLPIVLGNRVARLWIAALILALPIASEIFLFSQMQRTFLGTFAEALLVVTNIVVATRVLSTEDPNEDHNSYMIHTYWFCGILGTAIPVLGF